MSVRAKICGLARTEDARTADEAGASYVGVILTAGFGRSVEADDAAGLLTGVRADRVAVFVDEPPDEAERKARAIGARVLQLHGTEDESIVAAMRERGEWLLWKGVRPRSMEELHEAVRRYSSLVDGMLVEGWKEGVVGGGGVSLLLPPDEVRDAIPGSIDFVLAGGLDPDNVAEAVALFRPDVVDVSSGVEAGGRRKDPERVRDFVRAVAAASGSRDPSDHLRVPGGRTT